MLSSLCWTIQSRLCFSSSDLENTLMPFPSSHVFYKQIIMLKSHKSHTKKHSPLICHVSIRCQQGCLHTNGLCLCVEKLLCRLRCGSRRCSRGGSHSSPFIESRSTECLESRESLQTAASVSGESNGGTPPRAWTQKSGWEDPRLP